MLWTDKEGVTKNIKVLETSHLKNILRLLKKSDGKTVMTGGGVDIDDIWYDEDEIDNSEKIEAIELELRLRKIEALTKVK